MKVLVLLDVSCSYVPVILVTFEKKKKEEVLYRSHVRCMIVVCTPREQYMYIMPRSTRRGEEKKVIDIKLCSSGLNLTLLKFSLVVTRGTATIVVYGARMIEREREKMINV